MKFDTNLRKDEQLKKLSKTVKKGKKSKYAVVIALDLAGAFDNYRPYKVSWRYIISYIESAVIPGENNKDSHQSSPEIEEIVILIRRIS